MRLRDHAAFAPLFAGRSVLVAGGTGGIGGALVDCLLDLGADVVALGTRRQHPRTATVTADWTDSATLRDALAAHRFEFVFNAGGYLNPSRDPQDEPAILANHFDGTRNLLHSLHWDRLQLFCHVGSGEEYGLAPSPQREAAACRPASPYGLAKLMATEYCRMHAARAQLPIVVARPYIVYGRDIAGGVCGHVLRAALADQPIPLSPGAQRRDVVHIDDVTHALCAIVRGFLAQQIAAGDVLNIARGIDVSIRELAQVICELAGGGLPQCGALPYRDGESMAVVGAPDALRTAIDWTAQIALRDGLADTIRRMRGQA